MTDFTSTTTGATTQTLTATDGTWSIADGTLVTALAAGVRTAGALTVTGISTGARETAALTDFTSTTTGATGVTLTATDAAWSISSTEYTTAVTAGITFASTDVVTIISSAANDAVDFNAIGGGDITLKFLATAAGNGQDTISNFSAGTNNDILDFTAFITTKDLVGGATAGGSTIGLAIANLLDFSTNAANIITLTDKTTLVQSDFNATADTSHIKLSASAASKYVFITDNGTTSNIYYVTSDGTTGAAAAVTLVGTVDIADVTTFDESNFA